MITEDYTELLSVLDIPTVSLGYSTIHVCNVEDLADAQIGYSVDPCGASLIEETPGSWQEKWVVIGDDGSADPIFIDVETYGFPVYTAMHGVGSWSPNLIANGLREFAAAIHEIARVAEGRENPVKLQANPIATDERDAVLDRIRRHNVGLDISFWEDWLTSD